MITDERRARDLIPVFDGARDAILEFFKGNDRSPATLRGASIAASVLATYSRMFQAERAERATEFLMARELAEDKKQLREYIKVTQPDHPLAKRLGK